MKEGIVIHLAPEVLGHFMGIPITNTLVTVWVVMGLLILGAFLVRRKLSRIPGRAQVMTEAVIGYTFDYVAEVLESKALARKFFPLIMTIFIFILAANWFEFLPVVGSVGIEHEYHGKTELIPIFHAANTDLNVTIALALIAFFAIEIAGVAILGILKYGSKFVNFSSVLGFLVGIIELFSEIARLISFSFRLFGNIFAGSVLILVVMSFVPFVLPVPLMMFEIFVGFIQAFIFAILTLFFVKLAITEPH